MERDGELAIEILEPETAAGVPLFHVEHWPGFPDLWLYRTDGGDLRNVSPLRGLTPARLAPVARAIAENLEDAA